MAAEPVQVAFLMADYGHDPTETAVPFQAFKQAGFSITFITETGKKPECDQRMLQGWTGTFLGASKPAKEAYKTMTQSNEWQVPLAWSDEKTSLQKFDLLFLPGGHDKDIRQLLDSARAQKLVADFWRLVKQPSRKFCVGVCHGVQLLAHTKIDGTSILHDVKTTALTSAMENTAYTATKLFLGDYYKTYGYNTPNVEDVVKKSLDDPATQWKGPTNAMVPFVVEDERYNYLSGRWPGDALALANRVIERMRS